MKIFFMAMLSFLLLMTTVESAKIDAYRNIISSGLFTLKYTIMEPPVRVTNREATLKGSGFFGNFEMTDTSGNEDINWEKHLRRVSVINVKQKQYSYGRSGISSLIEAFAPIIPPEKIIATPYTPEYKFIGSGNLDDGLSYEDFFGSKNGFNCAIRYYFSGDTLTKIAVFNYVADDLRIQSYEKYLVQIDEFSATPDQSYLTLPSQLKDTTKRDKEVSK